MAAHRSRVRRRTRSQKARACLRLYDTLTIAPMDDTHGPERVAVLLEAVAHLSRCLALETITEDVWMGSPYETTETIQQKMRNT